MDTGASIAMIVADHHICDRNTGARGRGLGYSAADPFELETNTVAIDLDYSSLLRPDLPPPAKRWGGFPRYNFVGRQ